MKALILDTETTDASKDAKLVQAAWIDIGDLYSGPGPTFCQLYNPGVPISFGAMAAHNIHDEDVVGCPPANEFALPNDVDYLIGHNIDFDWRVIGSPDIPRICTLALARSLWPQLDPHTQGALLYYFMGIEARELVKNAHDAAADVSICGMVLAEILTELGGPSLPELWEHSEKARVPTIMPFGKHKGTAIKDVPWAYKDWLLRQDDVDPYLVKALRQ